MTPDKTPTDVAELEALLLDHLPASKHYIEPVKAKIIAAMQAAVVKWGSPVVAGEPLQCTCDAKDMPVGTCCKVRSAFETWYDEQNDGRLQPFDVFKGGWVALHRKISTQAQPTQAQAGAVQLERFLDAAASEGLVLDGIDAADLYVLLFPELYAQGMEGVPIKEGGQHGTDT